jgi:YHS domain-containing protein
MKKSLIVLFIISVKLSSYTAFAQNSNVRIQQFNLENGIAESGYDPVSYFTGKPEKGKKELAVKYEGVTYWFSNKANAETFKSNPSKYEPAYGGWCAYAMGAKGEKVEVDPETFKIIDGKVYLFYNKLFNNTLPDWNKDQTNLKKKADASWSTIFK